GRAGWIAFAISRHDDKAVRSGRRAEDRRSADRQRLNALIHDPYPSVIDPTNLRHQLSDQWQSRLTVGPVGSATAKQPDRSAAEKIIRTKAGNRIAGQQKHDSLAQPSHSRWAARPHGNAMNRQMA